MKFRKFGKYLPVKLYMLFLECVYQFAVGRSVLAGGRRYFYLPQRSELALLSLSSCEHI